MRLASLHGAWTDQFWRRRRGRRHRPADCGSARASRRCSMCCAPARWTRSAAMVRACGRIFRFRRSNCCRRCWRRKRSSASASTTTATRIQGSEPDSESGYCSMFFRTPGSLVGARTSRSCCRRNPNSSTTKARSRSSSGKRRPPRPQGEGARIHHGLHAVQRRLPARLDAAWQVQRHARQEFRCLRQPRSVDRHDRRTRSRRTNMHLTTKVNGELRQDTTTSLMMLGFADLIAYITQIHDAEAGRRDFDRHAGRHRHGLRSAEVAQGGRCRGNHRAGDRHAEEHGRGGEVRTLHVGARGRDGRRPQCLRDRLAGRTFALAAHPQLLDQAARPRRRISAARRSRRKISRRSAKPRRATAMSAPTSRIPHKEAALATVCAGRARARGRFRQHAVARRGSA